MSITLASSPSGGRPWWQPTLSHQHGPLVALLVSFLLGAAGAQHWTTTTTAALVVVLAAFQAEHPLVQQIRRRRNLQPRLLLWAGLYGAIALALGAVLAWQMPVLLVLAGLAAAALGLDALAVLQRRQRSLAMSCWRSPRCAWRHRSPGLSAAAPWSRRPWASGRSAVSISAAAWRF
jgi:hypothetical protein